MSDKLEVPVDQALDALMLQNGIASLESLFMDLAPVGVGQKFLRLILSTEITALLSVKDIAAVVTAAVVEVLPVPHMPGCVLGIYNWRGEMLWLVDLAHQLGFSPLFAHNSTLTNVMVVVIQVGDRYLGLCVQQVDDIEWHDPAKFYSPSQELFSSTLLPFVRGYLMADTAINCQRSIVLDASAILHAPLLNIHQSK